MCLGIWSMSSRMPTFDTYPLWSANLSVSHPSFWTSFLSTNSTPGTGMCPSSLVLSKIKVGLCFEGSCWLPLVLLGGWGAYLLALKVLATLSVAYIYRNQIFSCCAVLSSCQQGSCTFTWLFKPPGWLLLPFCPHTPIVGRSDSSSICKGGELQDLILA